MSNKSGTSKKTYDPFEDAYDEFVTCHTVGILGGCGETCPVFKRGDCEEPQDIPDPDGIYCEHAMVHVWYTEYEQAPTGGWLPKHKTHKVCTKCGYKEWPD